MTSPKNEGLSLGYRLRWRTLYILLSVLGPAQQSGMNDPRTRMRKERDDRVAQVRAERQLREGGTADA